MTLTLVPTEARRVVANDLTIGGGNAFEVALRMSPAPDAPYLRADTPVTDAEGVARDHLSLTQLAALVQAWSGWHAQRGVGPLDRVGIYVDDAVTSLVHFLALSRLGAIAVPVNSGLDADVALAYLRRLSPVGLVCDDVRAARIESLLDPAETYWVSSVDNDSPLGSPPPPAPYAHASADPVLLCHTSGTTGTPKSVIWSHAQMMEGIRNHLTRFCDHADSLILSALPQSHGSAIGYALMAMLAGVPLTLLAHTDADALVASIDQNRATIVVAFAGTLASLALGELPEAGLRTVERWVSVGDASHDAHVSRLVRTGRHRAGDGTAPGSMYVDGFGSSELGWGGVLSRITIPGVSAPPRCIGVPLAFAEVEVLRKDGTPADADEVGMLGVKGRTITPGYWNDSERTYRSTLNGYWLSGDLVYRDRVGRYFHVDRTTDAIETAAGTVYSTWTEELILSTVSEVRDCVVVAEQDEDGQVAVALVELGGDVEPATMLAHINHALTQRARPRLTRVRVIDPRAIPTGVTGKVLKRRLRDHPLSGYTPIPSDIENRRAAQP